MYVCMYVCRRPRTGVKIDAEQLEEVTEYKYLGRLITSGNELSKEIGERITSGWRRFGDYSHFLRDKKIPTCLKRKIMDTVILPAMTYGAETWTLTKHLERKLAVAQRSMERSLLNITRRDKIRNEIIRSKTGVIDIIEKVKCMKGQWGRTCSQNEEHQVGENNIRVDTQRWKTTKRKTQKEMER